MQIRLLLLFGAVKSDRFLLRYVSHDLMHFQIMMGFYTLETTRNADTRIWKASQNSHVRAWELYAKQLLSLEAALPRLS